MKYKNVKVKFIGVDTPKSSKLRKKYGKSNRFEVQIKDDLGLITRTFFRKYDESQTLKAGDVFKAKLLTYKENKKGHMRHVVIAR